MRSVSVLLVIIALTTSAAGAGVRVHMLRDVTVSGGPVRLDRLAVVVGDEEDLVSTARGVVVSRAPWPGEKIVVARSVLQSRLAASGISGDMVQWSGAEQVALWSRARVVSADAITEAARERLSAQMDDAVQLRLTRPIDDAYIVGPPEDLEMRVSRLPVPLEGLAAAQVRGYVGGREVFTRRLNFRVTAQCLVPVAVRAISRGEVLGPDNVRIEEMWLPENPARSAAWTRGVHGQIARRQLAAGRRILRRDCSDPTPPTVVKRGQTVTVRLVTDTFTITGVARALEDGAEGRIIKAENIDSRRRFYATVAADGTLTPLIRESAR